MSDDENEEQKEVLDEEEEGEGDEEEEEEEEEETPAEKLARERAEAQEKAKKLYDVIIYLECFVRLPADGWGRYSRYNYSFGVEKGRVISVLGEYKQGKTWFLGKLANAELPNDATVHTAGISMKLLDPPKSNQAIPGYPSKPSPKKTSNKPGTPKKTATASSPSKPATPKKSTKKDVAREFIILDTAGQEAATPEHQLNDLRSMEHFQKEFIYYVSGASIFVASRFNRPTQLKLNAILSSYGTRINKKNRLIVIINLTAAAGSDKEVYNIYDKAISDLYAVYESDREVFDEKQKLNKIYDDQLDIEYHQTDRIRFYFTVHDSSNWGKTHNANVIKHVRESLKGNVDIRDFNLQKAFLDYCNDKLGKYLVEWDSERMVFDYHEESQSFRAFWRDPKRVIAPSEIPKNITSDKVEQSNGKEEEEEEEEEEEDREHRGEDGELDKKENNFTLKEFMFVDGGALVDSKMLRGRARPFPKHYEFEVEMPGVPESRLNDIQVVCFRQSTDNRLGITITIHIPDPALSDQSHIGPDEKDDSTDVNNITSDRTHGKCHYTYVSPTYRPFEKPKDVSKLERSLKDGVFRIKLPRED